MRLTCTSNSIFQSAFVRRLIALLCLVGYLAAGTGLGSALAVAIAQRDQQHVVRISAAESEVRVVLHHDSTRVDRVTSHKHRLPTRLITMLTAAPGAAQSDHFITFSSPGKTRCDSAPAIATLPMLDIAMLEWASSEIAFATPMERSISFTRPPPANTTSSHTIVRATVFLI